MLPLDAASSMDSPQSIAQDSNGAVLSDQQLYVDGRGERDVPIRIPGGAPTKALAGFTSPDGATAASAAEIRQH
ncbi:hypothetical protein [Saccharopolyspora sp. NPDC002376]